MLGERLKKLRLDHDMALEELSDRLDIPVDCLQDIEEGKRRLSLPTIKEVAQIFDVPEDSLLAEEGAPGQSGRGIPPEVTPEGIGRKIRELRDEKGLSLSQISRRAGLSLAHLSEVERGRSGASLKTLEKIADVLEVSPAVLLGREECDPMGERLRRLRERVGLTQKELAETVGVSHTLVGQIETGRLQPSVSTLTRLAVALGVSPCYFLIEDEDVPRRGDRPDGEIMRTLDHPEVRAFLEMLGGLGDEEREKVLGLLSWLTDWRGKPGKTGNGCSTDPAAQELLQVMAGLGPEDKEFLLESARFVSRKARGERANGDA